MLSKITSLAAAGALALAGMTATPAQAHDHVGKVLAGIAAVTIIGAAVHSAHRGHAHVRGGHGHRHARYRHRHRHARHRHARGHHRHWHHHHRH